MNFKKIYAIPNHGAWVLVHQIFVRGIIGLKFFVVARIFGPDQIGLVGIAMLCIFVGESISETGLPLAIVQGQSKPTPKQFGAAWTLQLSRGSMVAASLFALADPISTILELPESTGLIALAASIPLLRNAVNPGVFLIQRDRNFRKLFIYETMAAIFDLIITLWMIMLGLGVCSIILGNIASDAIKCLLSWTWCRVKITPNIQWSTIQSLTSFGKWIWGSSVVTLVLNQLDKLLVARFMGATELGLYQMASRITQLALADGAVAFGQYLYPTIAERYRISSLDARSYLIKIFKISIPLALFVSILLWILAPLIIDLVLGSQWTGVIPMLRFMIVPVFTGSIIAILVAYLRGIGRPRIVTEATLIQFVILLLFAPILGYKFGVFGLISSLAVAGGAAAAYMIFGAYKNEIGKFK